MTSTAAAPISAGAVPVGPISGQQVPTPWLAQVWLDTVSRRGAQLGLAWVVFIGLVAVLAPLLANSYPIAAKVQGQWTSPMLRHFTAADVTLLAGLFGTLIALVLQRVRTCVRAGAVVAIVLVASVVSLLTVRPPATRIYEEYRELAKSGRLEAAVWAPVPFSPGDYLRDRFDLARPHPWAPSREHWMGTNEFGADILSHMIHACRIAMAVGFISTGIALMIGVVVGGLMGYFAGLADLLGMRLVEIFSAIPTIYLLLTFVAAFPDYRSIYLIMVIIGLTSWTGDARFVRAEFLRLRKLEFVHAAVAAGTPLNRILFRHLLPNAMAPLLVSASFGIAGAILSESTLSFLGLGVPVGDASWGQLLNQAVRAGGGFSWWLAVFPGFAIFFTVFSYNLIGEALRDALDPKLKGSH